MCGGVQQIRKAKNEWDYVSIFDGWIYAKKIGVKCGNHLSSKCCSLLVKQPNHGHRGICCIQCKKFKKSLQKHSTKEKKDLSFEYKVNC